MKIWKKLLQVDRVHLEFIGNVSRYIHTHYAIAFISDKMHHKTLKHPLPQSLVHIINYDIQRKNATLSARAVACPHNH